MADLVTRMREGTVFHTGPRGPGKSTNGPDVDATDALFDEAADEIERLRAENARLRVATDELLDASYGAFGQSFDNPKAEAKFERYYAARDAARAAIADEDTP